MAHILYIGTSGTDDPTRAGFPFNFALGAMEAGHQPEIFLAGDGPMWGVSVAHRAPPFGLSHLAFRVPSARAGYPWRFKSFGLV